jgi:hypothetical protein
MGTLGYWELGNGYASTVFTKNDRYHRRSGRWHRQHHHQEIKAHFGESVEIIALGTNAIATAQMLKAGANRGASGENAIVRTVARVDVVVGTLGSCWPMP